MRNAALTVISWKALHPERYARASEQSEPVPKKPAAKKRAFKPAPLTGRARKEALMVKARELAASGGCTSWSHLLEVMARDGEDAAMLRLWASAHDKDEIDLICARRQTQAPKRRQ